MGGNGRKWEEMGGNGKQWEAGVSTLMHSGASVYKMTASNYTIRCEVERVAPLRILGSTFRSRIRISSWLFGSAKPIGVVCWFSASALLALDLKLVLELLKV